jgi:hypothetical protein
MMSGNLGTVVKPYKNLNGEVFAIPQTWKGALPDYLIDGLVWGDDMELVTCTLNGRMWVFKSVDEDGFDLYSVVVLAENPETKRLEMAGAWNLPRVVDGSGYLPDFPVASGIDWVLTCREILQVIPEPPYILCCNIFAFDVPSATSTQTVVRFAVIRSFVSYVSIDGHEIGARTDPFTHTRWGTNPPAGGDGEGNLFAKIGNLSVYPVGTRQMEACYVTALDLGGWILLEDFVIPKPSIWDSVPDSEYHRMWLKAKPVVPVDLNLYADPELDEGDAVVSTNGLGYSATRRGIQIATFDDKLWVKSLMFLGRAYLVPLTKNKNGVAEEFCLFVTNSNNCAGPYNLHYNSNISENEPWMSITPVGLKDAQEGSDGVLAGFMTDKTNPLTAPICQTPARGDVLMPNDPNGGHYGEWVSPRPEDNGMSTYDFFSRLGLFLGEKGCTLFGGDSLTGQLASFMDYTCSTLSNWLAPARLAESPARMVESIDLEVVCGSYDKTLVVTHLTNYFHRELFGERFLPMAWGLEERKNEDDEVTEQVKLSFGVEEGLDEDNNPVHVLSVTEFSFPPGTYEKPKTSVPAENVFKDPYSFRIFRAEIETEFAGQVKASWIKEVDPSAYDTDWTYYVPPPFPCLIYKCDSEGVGMYFVNPEDGALTQFDYSFPTTLSGDAIVHFPIEPTLGTWGAEFRDAGFVEIPEPLPGWLNDGDWRFKKYRTTWNSTTRPQSKDKPGAFLNSSILMSASFGRYNSSYASVFPSSGSPKEAAFFRFADTSTHQTFFIADDRLGEIYTDAGGTTYADGWVWSFYQTGPGYDHEGSGEEAFHYCKDPIAMYNGDTRYKKNFFLWTCRKGERLDIGRGWRFSAYAPYGYWQGDYLLMGRIDYDPSVIDFDQELLNGVLVVDE